MGRGGEPFSRMDKVLNNALGLNFFYIHFPGYMAVRMAMHVHTKVESTEVKGQPMEARSFPHVGCRDWTEVIQGCRQELLPTE